MDTRQMESALAQKYNYKPLEESQSKVMRQYYKDNVPEFLDINGNLEYRLTTLQGMSLCSGYERIVVGDYGAFVEFSPSQAYRDEFIVCPGQEYRINGPRYKDNVKYEWYTHREDPGVKIYLQKRVVEYADYRPGYYYVSVHEVLDLPW